VKWRRRRADWADDRGSASLWLLGVALAVLLLAGTVAMAGGLLVARHRAQSAADLGALAGALRAVEGPGVACPAADRIVRANGGRMVACRVEGLDVVLTVRVAGPAGWGAAEASARAGPARASPASGVTTAVR
jgi:secretion/DNA translocation related TadE-like protein